MSWTFCLIILAVVTVGDSINKPVYKIVLTQKGYAQFLQYDVETPPLREFTFCTWFRVFDLENEQSIFTYVASGNNRVVRLWLDTGGRYMKISIDEKVLSSVPVDIGIDVWRHVCLSYQSDHGAWALYIDARLVSCEAAQNLHGRVLPGGGSVIVGYGIANKGIPNGLEGEIYGVNVILTSTIERNYTIKSNPQFQQKTFQKNKVMGNSNLEYIVLGDMKTEKIQKRAKPTELSTFSNSSKNYIKLKTPYSFIEHDVGVGLSTLKAEPVDRSVEKEIYDFSVTDTMRSTEKEKVNFWNIINEAGNIGKFKNNINSEISGSGTQTLSVISEYETPPPLGPVSDYSEKNLNSNPVSFYNIRANNKPDANTNNLLGISAIETPPPPSKDTKVYGQWTSSKFASSVLNYLKSINFNQREQKKIPPTIPLLKLSDSFPYASDVKVSKVRPSFTFQRRKFMDNRLDRKKREAKYPQINVQILKDDLRDRIIESHALTRATHVELTSRGEPLKNKENRFYRNAEIQSKAEQSSEESGSDESKKPKRFSALSDFKVKKYSKRYENNKLLTILPFLKTLEYYIDNLESNKKEKNSNSNDMYSKSLSNANKWHNVKSYSNDYTPRQINMNSPLANDFQVKIDEANKKLPSIRLKYKPDSQKVETVEDASIIHGRNLASQISNQSNHNVDSVSLIKYNHGFLPHHYKKIKLPDKQQHYRKENMSTYNDFNKNSFHKSVKLGNALNERNVIGHNEEQNKQSFVGGDETVPDINRYRSDIDRESGSVPPSLGPRICKNVELYDRLFYVQPDGSIDVTHILSPVREKNMGIEFIMQNYKKCSLENTALENSPLLFIDWSRTPVRLFGGAYPKKTTDLCGFF